MSEQRFIPRWKPREQGNNGKNSTPELPESDKFEQIIPPETNNPEGREKELKKEKYGEALKILNSEQFFNRQEEVINLERTYQVYIDFYRNHVRKKETLTRNVAEEFLNVSGWANIPFSHEDIIGEKINQSSSFKENYNELLRLRQHERLEEKGDEYGKMLKDSREKCNELWYLVFSVCRDYRLNYEPFNRMWVELFLTTTSNLSPFSDEKTRKPFEMSTVIENAWFNTKYNISNGFMSEDELDKWLNDVKNSIK